MRYVLWGLVGLLIVLAAVAAGGFFYIQHTDLAPLAVRMIKSNTGLDVVAEAPLTVKLLPQLEVHAARVTVPAFHGTKPLFKVDKADLQVRWGSLPLFWKGVEVSELKLSNPVVYLDKPANGPANWQTVEQARAAARQEVEGGGPVEAPKGFPVVAFGTVNVDNLTLRYNDAASGQTVNMEHMNVTADGRNAGDAKLNIDGLVNGNAVKGDVALGFKDMARVPLTANIMAADVKLALDGEVRDRKAYAGLVNVQTPNLHDSLAKLMGKAPAQAPASALSLNGDVTAGGEDLSLRNFSANLGTLLKANGDLDVAMGAMPSAKGTFSAEGSDLKALATLALGKDRAAKLPAAPFKIHTTLSGKDSIELKDLSAELDNIAAIDGNLSVVPGKNGALPKVDGQVRARGQNLRALAATFGSGGNLPTLPFSVSAKVSGQGTYTLEELNAQLATLAMVSGEVKVTPQPVFQAAGALKLEGQDLANTAKAFGVKANLPRTAYSAGFTLGGTDRVEVNDLRISLPQLVEAEGYMNFTAAAPHDLKGKLTFARLNLDALGYCQKAASASKTAEAASTQAPPASETPWSDDPLPLDSLNSMTMAMEVDIKTLSCTSFPAKSLKFNVANTASVLNVNDLHVELPDGGTTDMTLALGHKGTPTLNVSLSANKVPVQSLVRTLADKGVVLPVSGQAKLTSSGASTRALAQNLNGNLDFNANNGRIPYSNLLGNLSSIGQLVQGQVPQQHDQGLESMVAKYTVKNGVMSTDELSIKTGDLNLTGTGTINIAAWSIDYTLTPQVQAGDKISIPVNVKGPLGGPNIGPDKEFVSKLGGRLATEGLKGALGLDKGKAKGIGGAVGDLLGGKGLQGEGVQNLLQGLTAPKQKAAEPSAETQPQAPVEAPTAAPSTTPAPDGAPAQ